MPCWCWEVLVKFVHFRFHLVLLSDADGSPLVGLRFDEEEHRVRPFHPCEVLQEVLERQVCFLFSPFPLDARLTLLRSTASTPPTGFSSVTATSTSWRSSALSSLSVRFLLLCSPSSLTFTSTVNAAGNQRSDLALSYWLPDLLAVSSHLDSLALASNVQLLDDQGFPTGRIVDATTAYVKQREKLKKDIVKDAESIFDYQVKSLDDTIAVDFEKIKERKKLFVSLSVFLSRSTVLNTLLPSASTPSLRSSDTRRKSSS
jgi:hypothetical protein